MTVRKRGNQWVVDFFHPDERGRRKRFRRSLGKGIRTKRQAEAEETRLRAEMMVVERQLATGVLPSELPKAAFSGFARMWHDGRKSVLSHTTHERYESMLRVHLVPYFEDTPLTGISTLMVEQFRNHNAQTLGKVTKRPLAPKTVNEHISLLSTMMKAAVRFGYLRRNPCKGVDWLPVPEQEIDFYEQHELDGFLAAALSKEPDWYVFFLLAVRTGLRLGEMFALRWGDLDFSAKRVHVRRSVKDGRVKAPKNRKHRWVPMTPMLEQALLPHSGASHELVFPYSDGTFLNRNRIKGPFNRIVKAARVRPIRLHDLRHTFASLLIKSGVPIAVVQKYLGHKSIETTMRYSHLASSTLHAHIHVLDDPEQASVVYLDAHRKKVGC